MPALPGGRYCASTGELPQAPATPECGAGRPAAAHPPYRQGTRQGTRDTTADSASGGAEPVSVALIALRPEHSPTVAPRGVGDATAPAGQV